MSHHTKDKGDLGVLKALAEQGFMVLLPLTEHSSFDLVVYKSGTFKRVQVKYRRVGKNGSIVVPFRTTWSDKHGVHYKQIDKGEVDLFCVYCPDTDECYYFSPADFPTKAVLRVAPSKNSQAKGVRLASLFKTVPA